MCVQAIYAVYVCASALSAHVCVSVHRMKRAYGTLNNNNNSQINTQAPVLYRQTTFRNREHISGLFIFIVSEYISDICCAIASNRMDACFCLFAF